jgi:hypothetical protein
MIRICVCVPTRGKTWSTRFGQQLAMMMLEAGRVEGHELELLVLNYGDDEAMSRKHKHQVCGELVADACSDRCEGVVWLDPEVDYETHTAVWYALRFRTWQPIVPDIPF